MKNCLITACICLVALQIGISQTKKIIGGGCEGCELYAVGLPKNLDWETTMSVGEKGVKLQISGIIYQKDGKTPAPIDEFVFDNDPHMTDKEKKNMQNRGGNGIVKLVKNTEGVWVGKRDIVLGLNVPDYF